MKALAPVRTLAVLGMQVVLGVYLVFGVPLILGVMVAATLLSTPQEAFADSLENAAAREATGDVSIAADLYLVAWKACPDSRPAVVGLARTALAAERADLFPLAEVALGRLLDKAGEADDAELRVALARILLFQVSCARSPAQKKTLALRARSHLERAAEVAPDDAAAARLLAQAIDLSGDADVAVAVIDAFLERGNKAPPTLIREKGRILYDQAVRRHADAGNGYPLPEDVRRGFARARDLFYAAAVADGSDFDAWIHLAWAAHRLGEFEDASLGYEKAMLLDPRSCLPLRGLHALYANDPPAFDRVLKRLLERHPEAKQVLVFQGWRKLEAGEIEEAERLIRLFVDQVPDDADGLHLLGRILTKKGQLETAARFYWQALAADPRHFGAAEEIDRLIRADGLALAKQDRKSLDRVREEYQRLIEAAPDNPFVRNNAGFLLRQAWLAHRKDPAWRDVADLAIEQYDAAVEAIGRWTEERGRTLPWKRRILYAQIVCDAGILRDNWPEVADPIRAEFCFREALLWSDWGVLDAWTTLSKQYVHQGRDQDLYELALHCADGLKDAAGKPLAAERAKARAVAVRLETEGKVKVGQD